AIAPLERALRHVGVLYAHSWQCDTRAPDDTALDGNARLVDAEAQMSIRKWRPAPHQYCAADGDQQWHERPKPGNGQAECGARPGEKQCRNGRVPAPDADDRWVDVGELQGAVLEMGRRRRF